MEWNTRNIGSLAWVVQGTFMVPWIGTVWSGFDRLQLSISGAIRNRTLTPWQCFLLPQTTLKNFPVFLLSPLFNFAVSCERIYAIVYYVQYKHMKYCTLAAVGVLLWTLCFVGYCLIGTEAFLLRHNVDFKVSPSCSTSFYQFPASFILQFSNVALGFLTVIGYCVVYYFFKRRAFNLGSARERRLTTTVGIISFFALFFHAIPFLCILINTHFVKLTFVPSNVFGILFRINSVINLFVLYWRHKEIRESVNTLLLFWRKLPRKKARINSTKSTVSVVAYCKPSVDQSPRKAVAEVSC